MARSSDLPYLIVGVVLGSIVLLIVAFIPFCLWRAWSKQSKGCFLRADLQVVVCLWIKSDPGYSCIKHPKHEGILGSGEGVGRGQISDGTMKTGHCPACLVAREPLGLGAKGHYICSCVGPLSTICLPEYFGCQNSCLIGQPNSIQAELQQASLYLSFLPQTLFSLPLQSKPLT